MATHPTIWLAFIAGVLSFISPCTLPLYPSYISYISGVTFGDDEGYKPIHRVRALLHTLFFILGFSIVFFALGMTATFLGHVFINYRNVLRIGGGIIIVVMGLFLSGLISPQWLFREMKWNYRQKRTSYVGSVLVGISFSAGWTPCIGPILASVLVLSATESSLGIALTLAYIVGFAIPFIILGLTLGSVRKLVKYGAILSRVGGYILILLGILLITNEMTKITIWLIQLYGGFTGF